MIREANINDISQINDICQTNQSLISIDKDSDYSDWFLSHIGKSLFYVYELENKIIGFIFAEKLLSNGLMIWMEGVIEQYQNKGIGSELYQYLEVDAIRNDIDWIICYGYVKNPYVDKMLDKFNFKTNNNEYKEYLKFFKT